jgi:hypothetical protein
VFDQRFKGSLNMKKGMWMGGHEKEPSSAHKSRHGKGKAPARHSHSKRMGKGRGKRSM